jgi:hypothetical protein
MSEQKSNSIWITIIHDEYHWKFPVSPDYYLKLFNSGSIREIPLIETFKTETPSIELCLDISIKDYLS